LDLSFENSSAALLNERNCQALEENQNRQTLPRVNILSFSTTTIEHFEKMFIKDMETIINSRFRGKRRVDEFQKRL